MTSINFQFFIENDANPFILFTNTGKIKYLNTSAEVLMGSSTPKEIFDLALTYAPKTFGSKKSILTLNFNSFEFYGVNVLYENDDFIGIHLYNKAVYSVNKEVVLNGFSSTDINMLLQANIERFNIDYQGIITLLTDYDIPKFQIHQNNFSLLLRNVLSLFINNEKLEITVKIKIGERVIIKEKNYPIISIKLTSKNKKIKISDELKKMANKNFINLQNNEYFVGLEIPAINLT